MKISTIATAIGAAVVLGQLWTSAAEARVVREPQQRIIVRVPVERPYWDSYIVPRYRYRPEDDRVDPNGPPVVPVIRYGNQEIYLPWNAWSAWSGWVW